MGINHFMNIGNLELNKKYKYKELCTLLEQEEKSRGKSRSYQLRDWARYFNMYKPNPKGHFYIVDEIYDTVKEKIDNRGKSESSRNATTVYAEYIDSLLLHDLVNRPKVFHTTVNNIAETTCITNSNYKVALSNRSTFESYCKMKYHITDRTVYNNAFYHIRNLIKYVVESSIQRLTRRGHISYLEGYIIKTQTCVENSKIKTRDGFTQSETVRMANENEVNEIDKASSKVLVEFSVGSLSQLSSYRLSEYFDRVEHLVKDVCPHVIQLWRGYEITKLNIDNKLLLSKEDKLDKEIKLNELVTSRIDKTIDLQIVKTKNEILENNNATAFGLARPKNELKWHEKHIMEADYKDNVTFLVDLLTSKNEKQLNITEIWNEVKRLSS